jgi:transcriptional regulator with XRE-family HTH domain
MIIIKSTKEVVLVDSSNKFQYRLKELRKEYKMTQEELANKLGLVRTAIANYETGRTSPDIETLDLIANILNTTTDYLLGRSDIPNPYTKTDDKIPIEELKQSEMNLLTLYRKLTKEEQLLIYGEIKGILMAQETNDQVTSSSDDIDDVKGDAI